MGNHKFLALAWFLFTSRTVLGQVEVNPPKQPEIPYRPAVINSTYSTKSALFGMVTIHLHEENGQLTKDEKLKDSESSQTIKYEKVILVHAGGDSPGDNVPKTVVSITDSDSNFMVITFRTEAEAAGVAEYVGHQASLELIGGDWRLRKHFECPQSAPVGCQDFKELLEHDDADIVGYFYSRDASSPVYACFNIESRDFFVVSYSHYNYSKSGWFQRQVFRNGQSDQFEMIRIDWSFGELGQFSVQKKGQKPQTTGSVDTSSLSYQTKFANKIGTTTDYTLNIRWSTGRYTENYSFKDEKGKPIFADSSGICAKLN